MENLAINNIDVRYIVEKYADMVLRIAYQYTKNRADAEDIVQEAFLKLIKQSSFNSEEHIKAWLIQVTINLCKDLRTSAWHRKTLPLTEELIALSNKEQSVMDEVWELPSHYRIIIYLYYYEKYTIHEIANILGKKVNTINSQLQRARKKLKIIIVEGGHNSENKRL